MTLPEASAAGLRGLSSMAVRALLAELARDYARLSGQAVRIESVGGVDAIRRIEAGEAFDLAVLAAKAIDRLAAGGRVDRSTRRDVASSGVAVAVAAGAVAPPITSEDEVRSAVARARSIGYSTGPSGDHLLGLLQRWGLRGASMPQLVCASPGVPVGALVANGEAELGFQQASEFVGIEGLQVVGLLPEPIQAVTVFAAALCATSTQRAAVLDFLAYLGSPAADAARRRQGMEIMNTGAAARTAAKLAR